MSDFNTMFDEQVAVQESAGSTQRILEAMLKRDALEIQYRQQGISEAQIAEFHEAATKAIQEGFGDMVASAKGAMSRGMQSLKDKGSALWEKVRALFAKFVEFCKKVCVTIRNLFANDEKFVNRYMPTLKDKENKKKYINEKYVAVKNHEFDDPKGKTIDKCEEIVEKAYSYAVETEEGVSGFAGVEKAKEVLLGFETSLKTLKKEMDEAEDRLKESGKNKSEEEVKRLAAELKALRAINSAKIRILKAQHKAAKSFIIRCISKCKSVKQETVNFMVEACNSELDKAYAFNEAETLKDAWKKGKEANGVWGGIKAVGSNIWKRIVALYDKFVKFIKNISSKVSKFISDLWTKFKSAALKAKLKLFKKDVEFKVVENLNDSILVYPQELKSIEDLNKYTDLLNKHRPNISKVKMSALAGYNKALQVMSDLKKKQELIDKTADEAETKLKAAQDKLNKNQNVQTPEARQETGRATNELAFAKALSAYATAQTRCIKAGLSCANDAFKTIMGRDAGEDDKKLESYVVEFDTELEYDFKSLTEATIDPDYFTEADEVDPLLDTAAGNDPMHVGDVNLAGTEVLPQGASTDPNALDYDKTNCFSQTVEIGDEGIAGKVGAELGDTETQVKAGNETPSVNQEAAELAREFAELDAMLA